jgi:foldase protein PrsA
MSRIRAILILVLGAVLVVACGSSASGSDAKGTAVTVNGTKISNAQLIDELRIIAANKQLAKVLKKQDDTTLVPKAGTIDPTLAQAWIYTRVSTVLAERELARRHIRVRPANLASAEKNAANTFRGVKVFRAFPESFRKLAIARQAKLDALEATLPKTHEPTEAALREAYPQVERTCQDGKLVAQIFVNTKAEADDIAAMLARGADFATLARERSTDSTGASTGGVSMCIGSPRFNSSVTELQQVARATPIGSTSAPVKLADGWVIIRNLPLTYDNAHPLLVSDWHQKHPSPFYDLLAGLRQQMKITVAKRFGTVIPTNNGPVVSPLNEPVRL